MNDELITANNGLSPTLIIERLMSEFNYSLRMGNLQASALLLLDVEAKLSLFAQNIPETIMVLVVDGYERLWHARRSFTHARVMAERLSTCLS